MKSSISNNVKVYNLSAGKSLPEWITERKRRKLEQRDVEVRKRIQLVQDLEMPCISKTMSLSASGQYLFLAGSYKPIIKCYDFTELSVKFEQGLDSDVIKMLSLSEDYSKLIILEEDRFLEFHANYGKYFRLRFWKNIPLQFVLNFRIPHFGRDMTFCREASEVYIVGCHNSIFRLNLEQGKFFEPLCSASPSLNCCVFNDDHQLFVCGTCDGRVEAWDYRDRCRVATLDCTLNNGIALELEFDNPTAPEVTCVKFRDALHLGVGLSSGHTLLYDIRSSKPYVIKNNQFGQPIKCLDFVKDQSLVLSMDSRVLKVWQENDGKPFCSVEPGKVLNEFMRYPDSGLILFANDDPKVLQYFVPSLGPAPKWCSHLDSITEELEENDQMEIYDDFKFVTKLQLEELGLSQFIGTNAIRAYMHGYLIDMNAYKKAKEASQTSVVEDYRRRKVKEKLEEERQTNFVRRKARKLPKVNKELASRLQSDLTLDGSEEPKKSKASYAASAILNDERFSELFKNPDFEVNMESEVFQQAGPLVTKNKKKKLPEKAPK